MANQNYGKPPTDCRNYKQCCQCVVDESVLEVVGSFIPSSKYECIHSQSIEVGIGTLMVNHSTSSQFSNPRTLYLAIKKDQREKLVVVMVVCVT